MNLLPSYLSADAGSEDRSGVEASGSGARPVEPETAEDFARHVIHAICHASVTPSVGLRAYERCMRALAMGATARLGFRHPGKADAVDRVWRERDRFHREYAESTDRLAYLATLPWVGPVTRSALASRLGLPAAQEPRQEPLQEPRAVA